MLSFQFNKKLPQTSNLKKMHLNIQESVSSPSSFDINQTTESNENGSPQLNKFDLNFSQPLRVQRILHTGEDERSIIEWPNVKGDKNDNFMNKKFYEFTNYHQSGNIPIKSNV